MIWKTAWKNVWRNRVRSLVVISSVTIGVFAGVFAIAFMNGMIAQRVNAALDEEISHIQITGKGFKLNNDPSIVVPDLEENLSKIRKVHGISGIVKRTFITGMAGTATKSTGIQIVGINPVEEKEIFTLYKTIMPGTGDFFENDSRDNLALIGQDLAKELNIIRFTLDSNAINNLKKQNIPEYILDKISSMSGIRFQNEKKFDKTLKSLLSIKEAGKFSQKIKKEAWSFREGSKLTLTFLDKDNNQVGSVFRITAIYDVKNSIFEQSTVFVKDSELKKLSRIEENSFHQVIMRLNNVDETKEITGILRESLKNAEVTNWKELAPDLAMMTDFVQQIYAAFMLIILAALSFGIVNTMLMVVLERTRELGMLTAIGMNKRKVFSMIMLESVFLSLVGGVVGMFVGWFTILLTAEKGINFAQYAEGMEAFGYSAHVFPVIGTDFFIMVSVLIVITGILSSIYPALKALKLDPAEAIRTE